MSAEGSSQPTYSLTLSTVDEVIDFPASGDVTAIGSAAPFGISNSADLSISGSFFAAGSHSFQVRRSLVYTKSATVAGVAEFDQTLISVTGTLTIVQCDPVPAFTTTDILTIDNVAYTDYIGLRLQVDFR